MTTSQQTLHDELLAANQAAARFYRDQLHGPGAEGPRSYLTARGFAPYLEDEGPWTLGYAPGGWTSLRDHLVRDGFSDDTLEQAGLVCRTRRGTTIDKYRDRLTFGIRDADGHLIGYTSRCAPRAEGNTPKYLNTRHTPLFDKSTALFGLGEQALRLADKAILVLVEGPLDALAVDLVNPVGDERLAPLALCGTALTDHHTTTLAPRIRGPVIAAFDSDDAGLKAAKACYDGLATAAPSLSGARLTRGSDPAEVLQTAGIEGLRHRLFDLVPLAERLVDQVVTGWPHLGESAEARVACLRATAQLSSGFTRADRTRLLRDLPARLDLDPDTVTREVRSAAQRPRRAPSAAHSRPSQAGPVQAALP